MRAKRVLLLKIFGGLMVAGVLSGCASVQVRDFVPEARVDTAEVDGMVATIRFWGNASAKDLQANIQKKKTATQERFEQSGHPKVINFLTLSGGGADGAFGSGFLMGWRDAGTIPEFEIVTGISTGALIAPLAFLGQKYDPQLKSMFTSISQKDLLEDGVGNIISGVLGGDSLAKDSGLKNMIAKFVSPQMLTDIAYQHRRGRRLLVGTTNIDAQRAVIWDMGEIANSNYKGSLALFRQILLASASIPGAFPPVFIKVNAGGKEYQEMHVDGGVTNQVFLFPTHLTSNFIVRKKKTNIPIKLYVIRNTKIAPEWQATKDRLYSIASRSMETLIKRQGIGDLVRLYAMAKRDHLDYNLAFIPAGFTHKSKSMFDKAYMRALYQTGYQVARNGYPWQKSPPGFEKTPPG